VFVFAFLFAIDARCVGGLRGAGQRLRSGAFAPDCPCVILVAAFGRCLRIPLGLSTPRAPQATAATGSGSCNLTSAGTTCFLRVLTTGFGWWKILRGPLQAGRAGGLLELTRSAAS